LHYARAVNPNIIPALNDIAISQAKPTQDTLQQTNHSLDFLATYPNAVIRFYASDMVLHTASDVSFLIFPRAKRRIASLFFLSENSPPPPTIPNPQLNGV